LHFHLSCWHPFKTVKFSSFKIEVRAAEEYPSMRGGARAQSKKRGS
jgi:hypothetical protein